MCINLFWSLIAFLPLVYYISGAVPMAYWIGWVLVSLVLMFLPSQWYDNMQLFPKQDKYIKLGVKKAMMITQNGTWVNNLVRRKHPGSRSSLLRNRDALLRNMRMYERFHYGVGAFMLLASFHAALKADFGWALALLLINLFYNIYPILIQQYLKLRICK